MATFRQYRARPRQADIPRKIRAIPRPAFRLGLTNALVETDAALASTLSAAAIAPVQIFTCMETAINKTAGSTGAMGRRAFPAKNRTGPFRRRFPACNICSLNFFYSSAIALPCTCILLPRG